MEEHINKAFVTEVLSRMKKPSGLQTDETTVTRYLSRVMTLKKQGFATLLTCPEELYGKLCEKYLKAATLLTVLRPAGSFVGNLTDVELSMCGFCGSSEDLRRRYRALLTETTARRKDEMKRVNAANM